MTRGADAEEGEFGDDGFDHVVFFEERLGIASCGDDFWPGVVDLGVLFDEFTDGASDAVVDAGEHGLDGVVADGFGGWFEVDLWELGGVFVEGVELHLCAGEYCAAVECPCAVDEVDGNGCSGGDDDACFFYFVVCGGGVEEAVFTGEGFGVELSADGDVDFGFESFGGLAGDVVDDGGNVFGGGVVDGGEVCGGVFGILELIVEVPDCGTDFGIGVEGEVVLFGEVVIEEEAEVEAGVADFDCKEVYRHSGSIGESGWESCGFGVWRDWGFGLIG